MTELEALRQECLQCTACGLCRGRTHVVFGTGCENADIVFVGEGPGQQEDLTGEPFVGAAGKLLDEMLCIIDLGRHNCYIANIVKCRPPQNRDPLPQEQDACFRFLERQLSIIKPKIVVCLGRVAAKRLIKEDFLITREHGQWFEKEGIRYMATFHPSALLRDVTKRPDAFRDLMLLRAMAQTLG